MLMVDWRVGVVLVRRILPEMTTSAATALALEWLVLAMGGGATREPEIGRVKDGDDDDDGDDDRGGEEDIYG
jgi:hypothetical protein